MPQVPRTISEDLADRLQESLIWIDLRTKLMTLLSRQSEEGDRRAADQLSFVAKTWPGGGAPRSVEYVALEYRISKLSRGLTEACDALQRFTDEIRHPTTKRITERAEAQLAEWRRLTNQ